MSGVSTLMLSDGELLLDEHDLADRAHLDNADDGAPRPPYRRWVSGVGRSMNLFEAAVRGSRWALAAYQRWARAHRGRPASSGRRTVSPRPGRRGHREKRRAARVARSSKGGYAGEGDPPAQPRISGSSSPRLVGGEP